MLSPSDVSAVENRLPPQGKITGIQTCLLTDTHILKSSVLAIEKLEDLTSSKLGVSNVDEHCGTCDNSWENCGGHSGHMMLPIPVYQIHYVKRLISLLNCICPT